jgi:hypothetical protein
MAQLKKVIEHKMCVLISSVTFAQNISHCKKKGERHQKCPVVFIKVPVILVWSQWNLSFQDSFWNILKYQISWKSAQWEPSCSMHKDGWLDRNEEANSRFCNFANMTKNCKRKNYLLWVLNWEKKFGDYNTQTVIAIQSLCFNLYLKEEDE